MKSVLISTRPKWVEKICHKIGEDETGRAIYEKRIEVRKSAPQEVPFKAYIYCTYGNPKENYALRKQGKVIGEFICDKVDEYPYDYCDGVDIDDDTILETDIDREDINIYAKGKTLYGWHISDLKIYDKPKELSEFYIRKFDNNDYCSGCIHHETPITEYPCNDCRRDAFERKYLTRPPQSWQYIEDLGKEK